MQTANRSHKNPQARHIRSTEAERRYEEQQRNAVFLAEWGLKKAQLSGQLVIADSANSANTRR